MLENFALSGGKGGLGLGGSSKTGATSSGGAWNGSINYADKTSTAGGVLTTLAVIGLFVFFLIKRG